MKNVQTIMLVLLATLALAAVASAYDPIADNKVPSPKEAHKTSYGAARRLKQQLAANSVVNGPTKPKVLWGGYVVTPPYWVAGMTRENFDDSRQTATTDSSSDRRFSMVN